LLRFGADPDTPQLRVGMYDTTPSYIALVYDHLDCFVSLFNAGADPEGTSWGRLDCLLPGFTSFYHVAVKHNARPIYVWMLRSLGASLYRQDTRGRLACDVVAVDNASSLLIRQLLGNLTGVISTDDKLVTEMYHFNLVFCSEFYTKICHCFTGRFLDLLVLKTIKNSVLRLLHSALVIILYFCNYVFWELNMNLV